MLIPQFTVMRKQKKGGIILSNRGHKLEPSNVRIQMGSVVFICPSLHSSVSGIFSRLPFWLHFNMLDLFLISSPSSACLFLLSFPFRRKVGSEMPGYCYWILVWSVLARPFCLSGNPLNGAQAKNIGNQFNYFLRF